MIGFYGDIVFETTDKRILHFSGLQRSASSRWATHDVIRKKPASEFIGPDLDQISFTVDVRADHGVNPLIEIDKWLRKCRSGTVETFVIGNKGFGLDKWSVKSVSQSFNVIYNKGEVFSASVNVTLEEYVEVLR